MEPTKEEQEHKEKLGYAFDLCREVEAIYECPDHQEVHIKHYEYNNISELASQILERGSEDLKEFSDEDELTKYIEEALDCAESECQQCAEIYGEGDVPQC